MLGLNQISLAVNRLYGPSVAPALSLDFTSGSLGTATLTRSSTGTRFNSSGLLESVAVNGARFDFNPVTLAAKGLLVEGSRTNSFTRSAIVIGDWVSNALTTATNAALSPDGVSTVSKMSSGFLAADSALYQTKNLTAASWTMSAFVKADGSNFVHLFWADLANVDHGVYFNLSNGTVGNTVGTAITASSIQAVGNGWYRCSITFNATTGTTYPAFIPSTTNATGRVSQAGTAPNGILIWGAQLEAGAFPTSYIPTTTATVTRSADVAVVPIPSTVSNIRITYEDDATSDVAVTPSSNYTIPTGQKAVKSIVSI